VKIVYNDKWGFIPTCIIECFIIVGDGAKGKGKQKKMNFLFFVIRGMVIGIANIIPGVSGGTLMVSMGIYDKLIGSITGIFKQFGNIRSDLPAI